VQLRWEEQGGGGELLSETTLAHSNDLYFRERLPWRLGMVALDSGPTVIAHLHGDLPVAPVRVRVDALLDKAGQGVLVAFPDKEAADLMEDPQVREMSCDPKFRKVLVTDGQSRVGQALVRGLLAAQADLVWVGYAEPSKSAPGLADLAQLERVSLLPLDVTRGGSVKEAAAAIGVELDILVNNAEVHRTLGIGSRSGVGAARIEMDVNYFGLLRLAQEFGPVMRSRGADGQASATAWVNILSVFALSNFPAQGTFSASKSAAHSLSQCLRAEMQPAGIRVINVFPGPIDGEWNQLIPPPKLGADALAKAIVKSLQGSVEDVYPGDVAQEWLARWRENPKILERELAAGHGR
jgi:NAD(P)-dependent dehydrogenase (short-subunit alcohol dehydrogenase family)